MTTLAHTLHGRRPHSAETINRNTAQRTDVGNDGDLQTLSARLAGYAASVQHGNGGVTQGPNAALPPWPHQFAPSHQPNDSMALIALSLHGINDLLAKQTNAISSSFENFGNSLHATLHSKDDQERAVLKRFDQLPQGLKKILLGETHKPKDSFEKLSRALRAQRDLQANPGRYHKKVQPTAEMRWQVSELDLLNTQPYNIAVEFDRLKKRMSDDFQKFIVESNKQTIATLIHHVDPNTFEKRVLDLTFDFMALMRPSSDMRSDVDHLVKAWCGLQHRRISLASASKDAVKLHKDTKRDKAKADIDARIVGLSREELQFAELCKKFGFKPYVSKLPENVANPPRANAVFLETSVEGQLALRAPHVRKLYRIEVTKDPSKVKLPKKKRAATPVPPRAKQGSSRGQRGRSSSTNQSKGRSSSGQSFRSARSFCSSNLSRSSGSARRSSRRSSSKASNSRISSRRSSSKASNSRISSAHSKSSGQSRSNGAKSARSRSSSARSSNSSNRFPRNMFDKKRNQKPNSGRKPVFRDARNRKARK